MNNGRSLALGNLDLRLRDILEKLMEIREEEESDYEDMPADIRDNEEAYRSQYTISQLSECVDTITNVICDIEDLFYYRD